VCGGATYVPRRQRASAAREIAAFFFFTAQRLFALFTSQPIFARGGPTFSLAARRSLLSIVGTDQRAVKQSEVAATNTENNDAIASRQGIMWQCQTD
jgi:hypothetical protein